MAAPRAGGAVASSAEQRWYAFTAAATAGSGSPSSRAALCVYAFAAAVLLFPPPQPAARSAVTTTAQTRTARIGRTLARAPLASLLGPSAAAELERLGEEGIAVRADLPPGGAQPLAVRRTASCAERFSRARNRVTVELDPERRRA